LARVVGFGFGVAVAIGSTIGIGILRLPAAVAGAIPHPIGIILIWLFGGAYALAGSFQVIELGTMLPFGGGWYLYARRAFGDYAGFVVGLGFWLSLVASLAQVLVSVGDYLALLFPALSAHASLIAVGTLALFTGISRRGLHPASIVQNVTASLEGAALVIFVLLCLFLRAHTVATQHVTSPAPAGGILVKIASIVIAIQAVINTYDGWYAPFFFTEEDREPSRNLPRSIFLGTLLIVAIYVLVNLALLHVLPIQTLAHSTLPAADAGAAILGSASGTVITVVSLIILLSVSNALLLICSRIIFAMGRDGLLFKCAGRTDTAGTPVPGLYATSLGALLLIVSGTFDQLQIWSASLAVLAYVSGYLAVVVFRRRHPEWLRPSRAWGYPWTTGFAIVVSVGFLIGLVVQDPRSSLMIAVVLGLSYPLYRVIHRRSRLLSDA
jgi:APA family basic amino acid/polyamine antiporter